MTIGIESAVYLLRNLIVCQIKTLLKSFIINTIELKKTYEEINKYQYNINTL